MSDGYVFAPPAVPSLPVRGTTLLFPVRRVYCVGRNYAEHAIEMGHDPRSEAPFFFQKNPDSLVPDGGVFPYPTASKDVHHAVELVVALGKGGAAIAVEQALDHVFGHAVRLDMTRRDLQAAAPCSAIVPAAAIGHPKSGAISLTVNGALRQQGDLAQMIWTVAKVVRHLSALFTLAPGDLIFTGTPAGIGPVQRGDRLHATIAGVGELAVSVG